jgi:hypothetical protein
MSLRFAVVLALSLAACSAPVGVDTALTTGCQSDADCTGGKICAKAFNPPLCVAAPDAGPAYYDAGSYTRYDAGQSTSGDPDAGTVISQPGGPVCATCQADSDCGDNGNFCLQDDNGTLGCGTICQSAADCPTGSDCYNITDQSGTSVGANCFPTSGLCGSSTPTVDVCSTCQTDSDCGANGNICLQDQNGTNGCGTLCQATSDCPSGDTCYRITDSTGATLGHNCFPTTQLCDGSVTPPDAGSGRPDAGSTDAGSSSCTSDTWAGFAQSFLQNNCTGCHNHSFGNTVSYNTVKSEASSLASRIRSGNMPPGGGLNSSDKSRILTWLGCGAPR